MEKDIKSILSLSQCLLNYKHDNKKTEFFRLCLASKVNSMLESKHNKKSYMDTFLNIPLNLLPF